MPSVSSVWQSRTFNAIGARAYDYALDHPGVARVAGIALWGTDTRRMYAAMDVINEVRDGASILDLPVGGGVALRRLDPAKQVRYVAADISEDQLDASRRAANSAGLTGIDYIHADVYELPFADNEFDLVVTFAGLHCMPDPAAAIAALARVLATGGTLAGSCVLAGEGLRQNAVRATLQTLSIFGPPITAENLTAWLTSAGLDDIRLTRNGALAQFTARKKPE
ncbi:class I SAM-dependent methyltransferase [Nocardia sp. NPDC052566]|uniref:class I SAM-dependent methyltransferase n=1 Tax=Nocardia sp. NPDC052566 TaxID=3364330 RepID=UPI0037CB23A7